MAAGRKEQTGPGKLRPALKNYSGKLSARAFKGLNWLGSQRNFVFFELPNRFRADLRAIAAGNHIGHPVLHHDGQLRALIALAVGGHGLPGIFEAVAVETVMHGNPEKGFEPGKFGEFVDEPGRKKDL